MWPPRTDSSFPVLLTLLTLIAACRAGAQVPELGFEPREAIILDVHRALFSRSISCRDVVSAYISRIEHLNPIINAVTGLNPDVLEAADELDKRLALQHDTDGPLYCIPILVKDNYNVAGMSTHAGCRALSNVYPLEDAPVIKALKAAGAIILGKVNMHEMALEGLTVSSVGGQTLNPYDLTRTPGGSSGGSGAAIAASFAVLALGSDTVNSLRSPASANAIFSFRPSRGLISREGVIPVSHTQDALGAMGRSVKDISTAMTVMSSAPHHWENDGERLQSRFKIGSHFPELHAKGLNGKRIGILRGFYNFTESEETTPVITAMQRMHSRLERLGAVLVDVTTPIFNITKLGPNVDVQTFEYREQLNQYLQRPDLTSNPRPQRFEEIYDGHDYLVIPHQYEYINLAYKRSTGDEMYQTKQQAIQTLTTALKQEFLTHDLDVIIYPQQRNLVVKVGSRFQEGRNGILAAVTGSPVVVVPAGRSSPSETAPLGVPIGMEILGKPTDRSGRSENDIWGIAQVISEDENMREAPLMAREHVWPKCYEKGIISS